jgi:hypothetical protein
MREFAGEGRLAPTSQVARDGQGDWHQARDEAEFSDLFAVQAPQPIFAPSPVPVVPVHTPHLPDEGKGAHFAIFIDQKSHSSGNIEQAISSLGPAYKLLANVWIVSTDQSVNAVRNRLVQELGKLDSLFVVDATRGKAAWFNFGPEADAKIRRVWQKAS